MSTPTSSLSPSFSKSEQEHSLYEGLCLNIPVERHIRADIDGRNGVLKEKEISPPQSSPSSRKQKLSIETRRIRLSDKEDLIPSEISVVAQRLIKNDSVVYFLNNCRLIYESLMPSLVQQPSTCHNGSTEEFVIAAFDSVQSKWERHSPSFITVCICSFSTG